MSIDDYKTGGDNPGRDWERFPSNPPHPIRCGCGGWAEWDERRARYLCDCGVSYDRLGFREPKPKPSNPDLPVADFMDEVRR